jgi:uncharacterized protein (TIGR02302 family)
MSVERPETEARLSRARRHVARQARRARLALALERTARAFWPFAFAVVALFALMLIGVLQALPPWLHWTLLLAGGGAVAALLVLGALRWRAPSRAEARARLDESAPERPVAALDDQLALGAETPGAQALWRAHLARMAERAARARARPADLRLSPFDRFALRHAALILLAIGVLSALGGGPRLADALRPQSATAAAPAGPSLEAWASPPPYTGAPPIYLTDRAGGEVVRLPEDTEITLRVFDVDAPPVVSGEAARFDFTQTDGAWSAVAPLRSSGALAVDAEGAALADWTFEAVPDAPPEVAFTQPATRARSGALQFAFTAEDDYGVVSAEALVALDPAADEPFMGYARNSVFEPIAFPLPLPLTGAAEAVEEAVVEDLAAHPWAGLPVAITLVAEDGAGQQGLAREAVPLPHRVFVDPLARAIIEQRRLLAWSLDAGPRVRDVLTAVAAHPEDILDDMGAYLALSTAIRRLGNSLEDDRLAEETPGIAELLWEAALRIEDGDLSDAERRLRQLQQELSDALEEGASEDEIARLMDELRQAMAEYLQQLAQEALRDQADGQPPPPMDPDQQMMSQRDLEEMLNALEEALRGGMEELARQMLRELQQMLENLQMAQPGQQQGQGQGNQAMQQLQDMIGEQQGLADRSFDALRQGRQGQGRQGQGQGQGQQGQGQQGQGQQGRQGQGQGQQGQGQQGQPGPGQPGQGQPGQGQGQGPGQGQGLGGIARDQEALRRLLDDLRAQTPGQGGAGDPLGRAERSMGAARDALEEGDADAALQEQVEALDALREGAQELAQQLAQSGQAQQSGQAGPAGDVEETDPFGRPTASEGPMDGRSVRVPDAEALKRARELLDEIRRRAGERLRPEQERDYLRRLLERF